MANRFQILVNARALLVLFLLALPFNFYLFPTRTKQLQELSGDPNPIIDTWFVYSPERLFNMLSAFGQQGRYLYIFSELTTDLLYPVLYNLFLWIMMALIFRAVFPSRHWVQRLVHLPLFSFIADYLENFTLVSLLLLYPSKPFALGWLAGFFTMAKTILVVLCLVLILIGTLVFLRRAIFSE